MFRSKFSDNESGVILVTVIILTIVLSIVAIGIMSLNISQVKTSTSVVQTVTAEQLATGLFYRDYQAKFDQVSTPPTGEITIGGRTYSYNRGEVAGGPLTPNNTNQIQFNLTY